MNLQLLRQLFEEGLSGNMDAGTEGNSLFFFVID
jgi:hypothetical protein